VGLVARSATDLQVVADDIAESGGRSASVPADLADPAQINAAVDQTRSELGPIGVVVNAAGTDVPAPIEKLSVSDWDRVLDVNLRAPYLLAQAVFPDMRRLGGGTIVIVGSVAGRRGWPEAAAYCSSKFGLTGLTQVLNAEGRAHHIRFCLLRAPSSPRDSRDDRTSATCFIDARPVSARLGRGVRRRVR
jgi:NAD(P)-dependent dehydrogenase (short-subunit alcohol dehydrogenase family)